MISNERPLLAEHRPSPQHSPENRNAPESPPSNAAVFSSPQLRGPHNARPAQPLNPAPEY